MRWIKIYDTLLTWRWAHKPEYMAFAVHCLLRANPTPWKWEKYDFPMGSFVTSMVNFSAEVGITPKQYRTILKNLQDCGFLITKGANKFTLITICNFESYQENKSKKGKQKANEGQPEGNQRANEGQPEGNQRATDIEYKNIEYKNLDYINTHTEILQNFQNVCKNNTLAERLTSEFIAFNAEKNQEWWDNGLWKNHVQGFYRRDLKLKGQKTQSPQVAPVPPTVQKKAPQAPDPEAVKVWENVKAELKNNLSCHNFDTWIVPIQARKVVSDTIEVCVPSKFFAEYIETNFLEQIKTALNKLNINKLKYIIKI